MCGIVGFISANGKEAAPIVLNALRKLEYRGYDSAGMATSTSGRLHIAKGVGQLGKVENRYRLSELPGNIGIGHVRWATHGEITVKNAHPHFDCHRQIAVVHNGIINNYQELRTSLGSRHKFTSDTDTEVVVHLIEEFMGAGIPLESAVFEVTKKLSGSYALLVMLAREPQKIVAVRKDSPLVIGVGKEGNFIASDTLPFLEDTKRVVFVEDGETVVLTGSSVSIVNSDGRKVKREPQEVDWKWDAASKQGCDFFMLKEILEQPEAMHRALLQDTKTVMDMAMDILRAKQVVLTACGTSRYAALIGRYAFSSLAGKLSEVIMASELEYFSDSIDKNTLIIAVSQSGETADVIQGVKKAKENGATIFSLVNVVGSTLARMSDRVIYLNCGPEIGVAATKSFMNQLTVFYVLAFAMVNRLDEGIKKLEAVSNLIVENMRCNGTKIPRIANMVSRRKDFYYIARGISFAMAGEGALKLKEITYVHAEGMPSGELKHGTLALIEKNTPVLAICPRDYTFSDSLANVAEVKARKAFVIGVSDKEDKIFDEWVKIPSVEELFYPLVMVMPLQLFAYHSAIARGLDPDKPRNLAKSVTVK